MSEVGLNDPDVPFQGQQSLMLNEKNYKKFELTLAILTELLKQWHRESQTVEDQKKKKICVWFRNADGPFFVSYWLFCRELSGSWEMNNSY